MATSITQLEPLNLDTTANYTMGSLSTTGNITSGNINTVGQISATGNITGNVYFGNGSQLTGVATQAYATGMSLVFGG